MNGLLNVDGKKIQDLYKENEVYKAALELCSVRQRSARRGIVNIGRFRRELEAHGTKASREQIVSLFKKLQGLNLGHLEKPKGRSKKVSKFLLSANLRSIGKVATGEVQDVVKHVTRARLPHLTVAEKKIILNKEKSPAEFRKTVIEATSTGTLIIRKGTYELQLPLNVTDEDAKRAAHILEAVAVA